MRFPPPPLRFLVTATVWSVLGWLSLEIQHPSLREIGAGASPTAFAAHVGLWFIGVFVLGFSVLREERSRRRIEDAEAALARSRESYRRLVESTEVIPWEYDLVLERFTYVGPQVQQFIGRVVDPGAGLSAWTAVIHPEDRAAVREGWSASLHQPRDQQREYRIVVDGRVKHVRELLHVEAEEGRPARLRGFIFDVSEEKRAQSERQQLEERIAEHQRLESLGVLAGGIAHDFNNLLVPLIGYAEKALDAAYEGRPAPREIARVLGSAERARRLVRRILAFSADTQLERERLALVPFVEEALELLRASLPAHHELVRSFDAPEAWVEAEEAQLNQVILNLGANAAQAMNGVPGRIEVVVETVDLSSDEAALHDVEPGRWACVRVADDGPGIPEDVLPRIFDPFFTTKHQAGGTGLGLAMVHATVTAHGGWVDVDTEPGKGTTFALYLPLAEPGEVPAGMPGTGLRGESEPPEGNERILLVDDEEVIVEMVSESLETLGYEVSATTDPHEARAWLEKDPQRFDLLITDETMPGLSGSQLIIVAGTVRDQLPVIVATGMGHLPVHPNSFRGPDLVVSKPYRISTLAKAIREVLDGPPAAEEGAA